MSGNNGYAHGQGNGASKPPQPEITTDQLFEMLTALSEIVTRMGATLVELTKRDVETRAMLEELRDRGE